MSYKKLKSESELSADGYKCLFKELLSVTPAVLTRLNTVWVTVGKRNHQQEVKRDVFHFSRVIEQT